MPGNDVRHREPSDQGPSCPGKLVATTGPRSRARVSQDSWATLHAMGHVSEAQVTAGRPCGPSDTSPSRQGQMVDPAGHQTKAQGARESWSTLRHLGPNLESRGTGGRTSGPSDQGASCPGHLVNPAVHGPGMESPVISGQPGGPWGTDRVARDSWTTLQALGHGPESPGAAGRHRGHSARGPCRLGQLVDPVGSGTLA